MMNPETRVPTDKYVFGILLRQKHLLRMPNAFLMA
jgi:hypothetical protein